MEFPVDLLANVDSEALELSAKDYMSKLLYRSPEIQESLKLPDSKEIDIGLCNVSFVPLYGHDTEKKVLALFPQDDFYNAVGLYLLGSWWSAEDILKTADPERTGLLEVRTTGERIVLYVLNKLIYRTKEMASEDKPFLCHTEHETAKIFWKDGEAIGFYSVKTEDTCKNVLTQCNKLPVMDTAFIRRCHRRKGYGLQMLEDFMWTFRNDCVGLKYPLSAAMYKVCKKYLSTCPANKERLWEVQDVGILYQRTLIFKKLQTMEFKGDHQIVTKLNFESKSTDVPMEKGLAAAQKTMEYTVVEVVEEKVQIQCSTEVQDTPVTTRGRSSSRLKRKKLGVDIGASTEKMIRVEDIEARVQSPVNESMPEAVRSSPNVQETDLEDTTITVPHSEPNILDFICSQCEQQQKCITESEKYELEAPRPSAEPATAPPVEALEKTELFQMTVAEIKSMESNEETLIVKSSENTMGATDLQHSELVDVEIVKMTSGTEVEGPKEVKDKGEDNISEKTLVEEDANVICDITSHQKSGQQTELKTDTMGSEESSTTEIRTLRSSSRISTAAPQQKSTHLHEELQVASKLSPSCSKAATKHTSVQRSKEVDQGESGQAVDTPENLENQEMRNEVQMEENMVDIIKDANKARLTLSEQVLREEIKVQDPEVAVLQSEDIEIHGEKMIIEEITQEGAEVQKESDSEKREETAAEPADVEESDTREELLQRKQAISGETEESNNEKMRIEQRSVAEKEAGVLEEGQTEQVQGPETMKDTSIIQERKYEERKGTKTQVLSHDDDDQMTSNWTEKKVSEKEHNSETHAGCSGRFKDQSVESELTSRVLRSGTKLVGAVSKHRHGHHTKSVNQQEKIVQTSDESEKGREIETMGITNIEYNSNLYIETKSKPEKDFKEVEDGAQNETARGVPKIVIVDHDGAEATNDDDILVEAKTAGQSALEPIEQQEKEPATEMAQTETGQNVVVPSRENAEDVVTEEILQFQESKDQELVKLARTETDREESKGDEEKAKETEALIEPTDKEQENDIETSVETVQSEVNDQLIKASVAEKQDLPAELMTKTDSGLEESMSAGEKAKYDEVEAITTDEELRETNQKEVRESMTPVREVTVQESSPEEETAVITSRSLRQRTVTVKSPLQRKSKRFQKPELGKAGGEDAEMIEVKDKTDEGRVEEAEENKNEKMETEDGAWSKGSDQVPESSNPDQVLMEMTQEEEQLLEAKTFVIEGVSKSSNLHAREKSDNWSESDGEEDSDKADTSGKRIGSRRSNYATPLRRSGRFKDQSLEVELTKRVLRSGTKLSTSVSEQKHKQHTKSVKQQEKSGQAGDESEKEGEKETVDITCVGYSANLQVSVEVQNKLENKYLETESTAEKDFKRIEGSQTESTVDYPKIAIVDLDEAEAMNDGQILVERKAVQSDIEAVEEQEKDPATKMVQGEGGQNVVESTSVLPLQKVTVLHVDFNQVPSKETEGGSRITEEILQSQNENQELAKIPSSEKDREESKEDEVVKQIEPETELATNEQGRKDESIAKIIQFEEQDQLNEARIEEEGDIPAGGILVKPAEKEGGGIVASSEAIQSEEIDEQINGSGIEKEDAPPEMRTEELMMKDVEVSEDIMLKTDDDQEERMSAGEKVKEVEVEESVAVELHTNERETNQKEVQEHMAPTTEVTVQESSPEEETTVIISRSLRQRTVTVKSPPQRKSKRFQKPELETAEHENAEMLEVEDKTDASRFEEAEENKGEKMETEDGTVLKDGKGSADTEQGLMDVTQEEELLNKTKTFVSEDLSNSSHVHEREKLDNWSESDGEEDSDKAHTSGKRIGSRRSNYATPLRRSGRFKDQSLEGDLTKRVLRSGTKLSVPKQKHKRHTKPVKQHEKSGQAGDESETEGEMETVGITSVEDMVHVSEIVMDIEPEIEVYETVQSPVQPVEEREPATEMAQKEDGQNMIKIPSEPDDVAVDAPPVKSSTRWTSEEKLQSCKEVSHELEELAHTEQGRGEHNEEIDPLVEPVETSWNETRAQTTQPLEEVELNNACEAEKETGAEEPMTESLKELVMELGADTSMKNSKQGDSMVTEAKDDRVGETSLNEEYIAAVAINTAEVFISESEKIQKEDQEIIKPGHGETVHENLPEEEPPVITSRSLRRRTVMVKSPPQKKSKHLQKDDVELTENITVSEIVEETKDKTSETDQNLNEKREAEVTSVSNDADKVPEGQVEVVLEEESVKESNTQQEIPTNEETMVKEAHESGQFDETAMPSTNLAAVVKATETEEECKAHKELAAEPSKEHQSEPEMAVGPGGQSAEETAATGLNLQKTSVVLVDFNKAPPKQTTESGTSIETALSHEEVRQEQDKSASISSHVEEKKYEEDMMNQKEARVVPTEKEPAEKEKVKEVKGGSKGTSEEQDDNIDEMMETEEGVVKVQGENPENIMTVQEIQDDEEKETKDTQEPRLAGAEEKSDSQVVQAEVEHLGKRGKAHTTGKQTEQSAVETPVRGSRQLTDSSTTRELATRILRSSTKQVQTTSIQRYTRQTKAMVQRDKSGQAVDKADEYKGKTKEGPSEPAKEDKLETVSVITEGTTVLQDIKLSEEVSHSEQEEMEVEITTELFPQQDEATTEDVALKEATANEEKKSDLHEAATDVEIEAEGRAPVQTMAETAKDTAEVPVKEIAENEESLSVITLQRAAVILVDFNKVPLKQTAGIESTEETVESQEKAKIDEEGKQDQPVAESAEKEATSETDTSVHGTTQLQEQDVFHKTDGLEIQQAFVDIGVEKFMTQSLQEPVVGEEMLKEDSEQEKDMVEEDKVTGNEVGEIAVQEKSTATGAEKVLAVDTSNSKASQESPTLGHREIVQESSPEQEPPFVTSRSLRRRIVTVSSPPQRKSKHHPETEVPANSERVENTPAISLPMEVEMPEKKVENVESGNEKSEIERKECILREQELHVLIAEDIPETELEVLQETAEKGEAGVEESDHEENAAMASDTAVGVEVESTSAEELKLKLSEVKTIEVEHTEENTAPCKEFQMMPSTSLASVVVEVTSESEERVEKNNAQHTKHRLTKPAQESTNEESSEEEEAIITKNLRRRTLTVESPVRRRSKRLCREVVRTHEKAKIFVEASSQRETVGTTDATRMAVQVKITEAKSKDEREYAEIACELISKEVTTLDNQGRKNIPVIAVEIVETADTGEEAVVEGAPEEKVEESTESAVCEQVEVRDLTENHSPVRDPDQDSGQQENVLDITEELLLQEKSKGESRLIEEEKQLLEKEGMGNISTTEEVLDEIEEGSGVERRSLRKRTITIKATTERKSKRMCKKGVEHAETSFSVEEPVMEQNILMSPREKETTGQKDQRALVDDDKDGKILSEKSQNRESPAAEESGGETSTSADNQEVGKDTDKFINMSEDKSSAIIDNQKGEKDEAEEKKHGEAGKYWENTDKGNTVEETTEEEEEPAGTKKRAPAGRSSAAATPKQRSARRRKRFLQENEMESKSETKVVKEVAEAQEEKHQTQQKRKFLIDTPRRSKRLTTPKTV